MGVKFSPSPPPRRWPDPLPPSPSEPFYIDRPGGPSLIPEVGGFPIRLLHVETMTSHTRIGPNTYNGVQAPRYNIMSYTWGRFREPYPDEKHPYLQIKGVNWPIPRIMKEYFTTEMFLNAIRRVAWGAYEDKCDWVWLDVACIPQEWTGESSKDAALRGEEVGRQVKIFQQAQEVFAWLWSIQEADIIKDHQGPVFGRVFTPYLTSQDITGAIGQVEFARGQWEGLDRLEATTLVYDRYIRRILEHPWFESLWALQEMVLRSNDGYILLDDDGLPQSSPHKSRLRNISLRFLASGSEDIELQALPMLQEKLRAMADRPGNVTSCPQYGQFNLEEICRRLEHLTSLQKRRGLIGAGVRAPHTVYSAASQRDVTHLVDRIYGIVQVYDIGCSPNPKGNDQLSKLHALEDEFGEKLVQKAPVLSQLFLHSSENEAPRRSWLITQNCNAKVMGEGGAQFQVDHEVKALCDEFKVLQGPQSFDAGDLVLRFCGKAWNLGAFIEASVTATRDRKPTLLLGVDKISACDYKEAQYGLKLDYHISKSIFGRVVINSPANAGMHDTIHRVFKYYGRPYTSGREGLGTVVVALLGSRRVFRGASADYVGLVLVCRDSGENAVVCSANREDSSSVSREHYSTAAWERIGLMIWHEAHGTSDHSPHSMFPLPYIFQCSIV